MKFIYFLIVGLLSFSIAHQDFIDVLSQYIMDGNYALIDLDDYVDYDDCYDLQVSVSSFVGGDILYPDYVDEEYDNYRENMTVTLKIQYAGFDITPHANDKIWVLDEEENLTEINIPHNDPFNLGGQLFFLNIKGNFDFYQATVVYYSGDIDRTFAIDNAFEYRSNKIIGSPLEPYVIDLAPLLFEISNDNVVTTQLINPSYSGGICLQVDLVSCDGSNLGSDTYCYEVGDNPCVSNLIVNQVDIDGLTNGVFEASQNITSDAQIAGDKEVVFSAMECITLESGFVVDLGAVFTIDTIGCN